MNPKLLIVDDDDEIRTQMKWALAKDYDILVAENRADAVETFQARQPPVVLLDLGLPPQPGNPEEGLAALSELLALDRLAKVVIVSGQGEKEVALRAIGAGAYDFLCKPVEMEELKFLLKRCFHVAQLEREYREMQQLLQGDAFEGMLGTSRPMQAVFDKIRKVATTDAPVLRRAPFIRKATGKRARLWPSTVARSRKHFWKANCLAMKKARSPALMSNAWDESKPPMVERSFWMRSGKFPCPCRSSFFDFSKSSAFSGWAADRTSKSRRAWSRQPMPI